MWEGIKHALADMMIGEIVIFLVGLSLMAVAYIGHVWRWRKYHRQAAAARKAKSSK